MTNWNGLDSAGTEQLWSFDIINDMLLVFKQHEPCSRADPDSPIFSALEKIHPEITWRNTDVDGSFRPIFRKANPLSVLGLTSDDAHIVEVTDLGNELLAGLTTLKEVFITAMKTHNETDGDPSYRKICRAACEVGESTDFTLEVIEFGISKEYNPEIKNATEIINAVKRDKTITLTDDTRKRRIRSFMMFLVNVGAFVETQKGSWRIYSHALVEEIAGAIFSPSTESDGRGQIAIALGAEPKPKRSNISVIDTEKNREIKINTNWKDNKDPIQKVLLLEKASNEHERIVIKLANYLTNFGYEPLENHDSFDVGICGAINSIFEVKSVNKRNCKGQIRKAIVQLLEYSWAHEDTFGKNATRVIILNSDPRLLIEKNYLNFVVKHIGLYVYWEKNEDFVTMDGVPLSTFLTLN